MQNEPGGHEDSGKVSRITEGQKDENDEVYGCTGTAVNAINMKANKTVGDRGGIAPWRRL